MIRPRTKESSACLCFPVLSGAPNKKPWKRDPDMSDPSRSVILDLQTATEWKMDSTIKQVFLEPMKSLEDDMQVQCFPVYRPTEPRWMYRKVPCNSRVVSKTQQLVYSLRAETITKGAFLPTISLRQRDISCCRKGCSHPSHLQKEEDVQRVLLRAAHRN